MIGSNYGNDLNTTPYFGKSIQIDELIGSTNAQKYQRLETIVKRWVRFRAEKLDKDFSDISETECHVMLDTLEMYHALQIVL